MRFGSKYKIGISNNPEGRYKTFLTGNPDIKLICYSVPVTFAHKLEKSLHRLLLKEHVHGEWFHLKQSDVDAVVRLLTNIQDTPETIHALKQLF